MHDLINVARVSCKSSLAAEEFAAPYNNVVAFPVTAKADAALAALDAAVTDLERATHAGAVPRSELLYLRADIWKTEWKIREPDRDELVAHTELLREAMEAQDDERAARGEDWIGKGAPRSIFAAERRAYVELGFSPIPRWYDAEKNTDIFGTDWSAYCHKVAPEEQLKRWDHTPQPVVNIALCTGYNGLVAIDFDWDYEKHPESKPWRDALLEALPHATVGRFGSKGFALLMRYGDGEVGKGFNLTTGERPNHKMLVEVKGKGGNITVPNSLHHSTGHTYYWFNPHTGETFEERPALEDLPIITDKDLEAIKQAFAPWATKPKEFKSRPRDKNKKIADEEHKRFLNYSKGQLAGICRDDVGGAVSHRNDALNEGAFKIGWAVRKGYLSEAEVVEGLIAACERNGLIHDDGLTSVENTIDSGLRAGIANCDIPELLERSDRAVGRDLGAKVVPLADRRYATQLPPKTEEDADPKPRIKVESANPDRTVAELRDILADAGGLYDRGAPVRLAYDQLQQRTTAQVLTADDLVLHAHSVCRPFAMLKDKQGKFEEQNIKLPRQNATMYLGWRGEWKLPVLNGIATAPLLRKDGSIHCADGYDPESGMWCEGIPDISGLIPEKPTKAEAESALMLIRNTFKTFPFADAVTVRDPATRIATVDLNNGPAKDESGFLNALLTAVCRPSLWLAPGTDLRAPSISGAGTGKGLLARCICAVAFGHAPSAVTGGHNAEELEKRIAAELMEASSVLFLDNLNDRTLKSDTLASAISERPSKVRDFCRLKMITLNAVAFVIVTGNGLVLSEDLVRRFIVVDFDAGMEDPEVRAFDGDILAEVIERRAELLAACLTIWRFGRRTKIKRGISFEGFKQWAAWVRDPLLTLGCQDPIARLGEIKKQDPRRKAMNDLFEIWRERHGSVAVTAHELHDDVKAILVPKIEERTRQKIAARVSQLAGMRLGGYGLNALWSVELVPIEVKSEGSRFVLEAWKA